MKTISISILVLALAIGYTSYSISHRPVYERAYEVKTYVESPTDDQVEKYYDDREGYHYPLEIWADDGQPEEFSPVNL